jgi:hypothetical protein
MTSEERALKHNQAPRASGGHYCDDEDCGCDSILAAEFDAVRREALEEAAQFAKNSNFVDGPEGTVEGQIARAIRALQEEP